MVTGTFTLSSANGTVTIRSGSSAANVVLQMSYTCEVTIGPSGKPYPVRMPVCPTLGFRPDLSAYVSGDVSQLISRTAP